MQEVEVVEGRDAQGCYSVQLAIPRGHPLARAIEALAIRGAVVVQDQVTGFRVEGLQDEAAAQEIAELLMSMLPEGIRARMVVARAKVAAELQAQVARDAVADGGAGLAGLAGLFGGIGPMMAACKDGGRDSPSHGNMLNRLAQMIGGL